MTKLKKKNRRVFFPVFFFLVYFKQKRQKACDSWSLGREPLSQEGVAMIGFKKRMTVGHI